MKEFISKTNGKLSKLILKEFPELSYGQVATAIKNKDIKINETRISKDFNVFAGDKISVYIDFNKLSSKIKRIYEDDNVMIVFKPVGIEVKGNANDLVHILEREGVKVIPCHRIDVNTEGLVLLAKTKQAEDIIIEAFKSHNIKKSYTAWVVGHMTQDSERLRAYLVKDSKKAVVKIYDNEVKNAKEIITSYKVLEDLKTTSLLKLEIETGRTHQIRAHLAHIGHAIIGDDKYGNFEQNKTLGLRYQALTATELTLNFNKTTLSYLNGKIFKVSPTWLKYLERDR